MSDKNVTDKTEARKKMKELVENIDFGMLITKLGNTPLSAIPMSTKKVDDQGNIWFLSGLSSEHNTNIATDPAVQILYSNPGDMEFISIYGSASIETDKPILDDLYGKMDDAWFNGVDDPNLTAIKVKPESAYYWDTKQNKFISFFKMGMAAFTNEKTEVGEKGKLNL